MDALNKEFLINHGFKEDAYKKALRELFTSHKQFKEVNISVNSTEPFMLLARSREKNVSVKSNIIQDKRLVLEKGSMGSGYNAVIMNILLDEINNCLYEYCGNGLYDFEFEVRGFRHSLHIAV